MARNPTIGFRPDDEEQAELVRRANVAKTTPGLVVAEIVRERLKGLQSESLSMAATIGDAEERGVQNERARQAGQIEAMRSAAYKDGFEAGSKEALKSVTFDCLVCEQPMKIDITTRGRVNMAVEEALAPWLHHDGVCEARLMALSAGTWGGRTDLLRQTYRARREKQHPSGWTLPDYY